MVRQVNRKSTKHRKVHRETWRTQPDVSARQTVCGRMLESAPNRIAMAELVTTNDAFIWLPAEYQCDRCGPPTFVGAGDQTRHAPFPSATPEMVTIVEALCVAIARFGQVCADQLGWVRDPATGHWCDGPNEEHRCWFDAGREVCRQCECDSWLMLGDWLVATDKSLWEFRVTNAAEHGISLWESTDKTFTFRIAVNWDER
jgi:hypothetical protein